MRDYIEMLNMRTKKFKTIYNSIASCKSELKTTFGVRSIGIFGSYATGRFTRKSDLDILVEFEKEHKSFDNYMDLKFYLEKLAQINVDLILKNVLKPRLKKHILLEVIYV